MQQDYELAADLDIPYAQVEFIAQTAYAANRAYSRQYGDFSHPTWEDLPQTHQRALRRGVLDNLATPDVTPEENHERWMVDRLKDGWTYGTKRDQNARINPALVPWPELPVEQRRKNAMFQAIVGALDPRK